MSTKAWLKPLCEVGPIAAFFIANSRWDIFVGTAVFIVATAIALPAYRMLGGRWPILPLVGGFFVLVFGALTLLLQDELFIKLKPTIVNLLFAAILLGGLLFNRSLLQPLLDSAFKLTPLGWRLLTWRWCGMFAALAIINEIMWRGFSTDTWIASKLALSMPLTILFGLAQIPLIKRHWDGDNNPFAAEEPKA
jgi:intracellular septation protein